MKIFDMEGIQTGKPFKKKEIIGFFVTLAIFVICMIVPLNGVTGDGTNVNLVLATVMFVVVSQITGWLTMAQALLPAVFVWVAAGMMSPSAVVSRAKLAG